MHLFHGSLDSLGAPRRIACIARLIAPGANVRRLARPYTMRERFPLSAILHVTAAVTLLFGVWGSAADAQAQRVYKWVEREGRRR